MKTREELLILLETILGVGVKVYLEPPSNIDMIYPCIVCQQDLINGNFAENQLYMDKQRWTLTLIESDYTTVKRRILDIQCCRMDRCFKTDNKYHTVFTLYY